MTVFAVTALLLVACGGSGNSSESDETVNATINVLMNDIYFGESNDNASNPPVWTVSSGANVTVNLDNQGALQHNWAIVKAGEEVPAPFDVAEHSDILLYSTELLNGGTTASATFTAPEPGEYLVICTVAGHYPSMQGMLVVN
jgi:plastocyanin